MLANCRVLRADLGGLWRLWSGLLGGSLRIKHLPVISQSMGSQELAWNDWRW
jgi:hypothetical protein